MRLPCLVKLQTRTSLSNYKGVRKLLEITSEKIYLLCDSIGIYGFGKLRDIPYIENSENLFIVEFNGHHKWILLHNDNRMMVVEYGLPKLPSVLIQETTFQSEIKTRFPRIAKKNIQNLWKLVDKASAQRHGTMLVISDNAKQESERLSYQSTAVDPIRITPELILSLSSIDGALLLDDKAVCYSIGVILDGIATTKGDPSRGARYNSAIRYRDYVCEKGHRCLIVVISEDGMINLI